MEKELKQLLLKDLCARLPYKVRVKQGDWEHILQFVNMYNVSFDNSCAIPKPYLRSMSDITEEEKAILIKLMPSGVDDGTRFIDVIDYLNSIHIDYRGLIDKGLAIRVTKDNNPYKD